MRQQHTIDTIVSNLKLVAKLENVIFKVAPNANNNFGITYQTWESNHKMYNILLGQIANLANSKRVWKVKLEEFMSQVPNFVFSETKHKWYFLRG